MPRTSNASVNREDYSFNWRGKQYSLTYRLSSHRFRESATPYLVLIGSVLVEMGIDTKSQPSITTADWSGASNQLRNPGMVVRTGMNALIFSVRPEGITRENSYAFRVSVSSEQPLEFWLEKAKKAIKRVLPITMPKLYQAATELGTSNGSDEQGEKILSRWNDIDSDDDNAIEKGHTPLQAPALPMASPRHLTDLLPQGVVSLEVDGITQAGLSKEKQLRHALIIDALCESTTDEGLYVHAEVVAAHVREKMLEVEAMTVYSDLSDMAKMPNPEVEEYFSTIKPSKSGGYRQFYRLTDQVGLRRVSLQEAIILASIQRHGEVLTQNNRAVVRYDSRLKSGSFDATIYHLRGKKLIVQDEAALGEKLQVNKVILYPKTEPINGRTICLANPPEDVLPAAPIVAEVVVNDVPQHDDFEETTPPPEEVIMESKENEAALPVTAQYEPITMTPRQMALWLADQMLATSGSYREFPSKLEANRAALAEAKSQSEKVIETIKEMEAAMQELNDRKNDLAQRQEDLEIEQGELSTRIDTPTPEQAKEAASFRRYLMQLEIAQELEDN